MAVDIVAVLSRDSVNLGDSLRGWRIHLYLEVPKCTLCYSDLYSRAYLDGLERYTLLSLVRFIILYEWWIGTGNLLSAVCGLNITRQIYVEQQSAV